MKTMSEIILHHYPPSPVSEKVRVAFGIKGMTWHSVEQNRLPDRPELFAMTGGYRRIPVMQIGADIYCDTQCILRELETRVPEPTLFPNGSGGMPFALSRWTDDELFQLAFRVGFAPVASKLPPALVADRTRLYMGSEGDLAQELENLPHTLAQLRAMMGWMEDRLSGGVSFLLGDLPGMPDLLTWYIVWFIRERYEKSAAFFAEFPALNLWADRMAAIGHGEAHEMSKSDAFSIASDSKPTTPQEDDALDPQGLKPGMRAAVLPLTNSGETAVEGVVRVVNRNTIALTIENDLCGEMAVHFPRVGYRVIADSSL